MKGSEKPPDDMKKNQRKDQHLYQHLKDYYERRLDLKNAKLYGKIVNPGPFLFIVLVIVSVIIPFDNFTFARFSVI